MKTITQTKVKINLYHDLPLLGVMCNQMAELPVGTEERMLAPCLFVRRVAWPHKGLPPGVKEQSSKTANCLGALG